MWNVEHDRFHAELQWPLHWSHTKQPSLLMTFAGDVAGCGWYSRYILMPAFLNYLSEPGGTREGYALGAINNVLLDMQREIGRLRSGAHVEPHQ